MAQQSFAGLAVLIALTFCVMALAGCASTEQPPAVATAVAPVDIASIDETPGTPEFHGARISADGFRSRLPSDD
jgi:hypothetical protein